MDKKKIIWIVGALALTGTLAYVISFNRRIGREWYFGLPEAVALGGGLALGVIIFKLVKN